MKKLTLVALLFLLAVLLVRAQGPITPHYPLSTWSCPDSLEDAVYVGNRRCGVDCSNIQAIRPEDRLCFGSREAAIAIYFYPICEICSP